MEEQNEANAAPAAEENKVPRTETGDAENAAEQPKRKVVLAPDVKVVFSAPDGKAETEMAKRDVFSVINAITGRLARTKSKAEMESIKVSVHSVEDLDKSEPRKEGEAPFEGPYLVAGLEVEGKSIPDAVSELTKGVIPGDAAIKQFELLAEQLFLRSMLDAVTVVAGFSTGMAVIPLINSMRDVDARTLVGMYHGLHDAAERLRSFCEKHFPEKEFDFDAKPEEPKDEEPPSKRIVLPSGLPASMAEKGVVTPEEARKDQVKVVHLV